MAFQQLRSDVLGSSAERVGFLRFGHIKFAEAEVAKGDVTGVIQKNVLGFEVAVLHI